MPKILPHDFDAEGSVISALLRDPTAHSQLAGFLLPEHFYSEAHRRLYEAALALRDKGDPVDTQTVLSWLAEHKRGPVGGAEYISELLDACPVVTNVRAHGVVILEHWQTRRRPDDA